MEEDFTQEEIEYANESFSKADLRYIKEMNQEKYGFKKYFIKQ